MDIGQVTTSPVMPRQVSTSSTANTRVDDRLPLQAASQAVQVLPGNADTKDNENDAASPQAVNDAVDRIQNFMESARRNLNFSIDKDTGRVVVKVLDGESGDVIRQIPSEDALKLAARLGDAGSLLFDTKV